MDDTENRSDGDSSSEPEPSPEDLLAEAIADGGEIDWEEFWRVVKGNGPCNKQRLAARQKAHDQGAWVRAVAEAYAEKHNATAA